MPDDGAPHPDLEHEQRYLSTLYTHLDELREYTQTRLKRVLLETGGTPQARSERESFTQMYTEDLAKYDAAEHGLCFGRVDVRDDVRETEHTDDPDTDGNRTEARYIGRIGILDEDNDYESLLLDWRAPLARPFYLATPAAPDGVVLRRHIRSRNRTVTALNDEYLDLDTAREHANVGSAGGVAGESALLDALNAARTADARHRRDDPVGAGRDHPLRAQERARGAGRTRHRQDRGRSAPSRLSALHLSQTTGEERRAHRRTQLDVPRLHRPGAAVAG